MRCLLDKLCWPRVHSRLTHRSIFAIALAFPLPTVEHPAVAASAADERNLHLPVYKDRSAAWNRYVGQLLVADGSIWCRTSSGWWRKVVEIFYALLTMCRTTFTGKG